MSAEANRRPLRLIHTVLVRDEVDVIGANIRYHLAQGVDHVIATDNGSTDGTREVLAEFAAAGALTLLDEPSLEYQQDRWMTRMATMARSHFGADWVIPGDADEFWMPKQGTLKDCLCDTDAQMLRCGRVHLVAPVERLDEKPWPDGLIWRSRYPSPRPDAEELEADRPLEPPLFSRSLAPKMILRAEGLNWIKMGAHRAIYESDAVTRPAPIVAYHVPVRETKEFEASVRLMNVAAESARARVTGKYRRWYRLLEEGRPIEDVLAEAIPREDALTSGGYVEDTTLRDALRELGSDVRPEKPDPLVMVPTPRHRR